MNTNADLPSDQQKLARLAVGQLVLAQVKGDQQVMTFLGSCFACLSPHSFATAHHCISGLPTAEMFVVSAIPPYMRRVTEIVSHTQADVSLVKVQPSVEAEDHPVFELATERPEIGDDFVTYGYPPDVFGVAEDPAGRLFKGHFQRFMFFQPHWGAEYNYVAAELSIPCPEGLSGAPLYSAGMPLVAIGLITWNLRTTIGDERIEYGVALRIPDIAEWLSNQQNINTSS
jgi:hypothetical protein